MISNHATPIPCGLAKNDLNYTYYHELTEHRDLLSDGQCQLLSHLNRRRQKGEFTDEFISNASIFTLIEHPEAYNHVHCGEAIKGGRVTCRDKCFCQNCANIPAVAFLKKTVTRFNRGYWFFVTLSFDGGVPFGSRNMTEGGLYWRVTREAYRDAGRLWAGSVYREEVAIHDFLPLAIKPHAHILVFSNTPWLDKAALKSAFEDAARPHHLVSALSVDIQRVSTLDSYLKVVRYLFKPVNLGGLYRKTWALLGEHLEDRELVLARRQVNNELTDFVYGIESIRTTESEVDYWDDSFWSAGDAGRDRFIYKGVLNSNSKKCLYLSKRQMNLARAKIDRILRQGEKGEKRLRKRKV